MLPTKGYFQDIECPYFEHKCTRPFCHFLHRRKIQENSGEPQIELPETISDVPTYKPTPKSELANNKSHIPISYVPDLEFRPSNNRIIRPLPKFEKPTYNPTPISILSSANSHTDALDDKDDDTEKIKTIREIQQNIADVEYTPEGVDVDIDFEELSEEFNLIDELIDEPQKTKTYPKEETKKKDRSKEKSDNKHRSKSSSNSSRSSDRSKERHKDRDRDKEREKEKHHKSDKERDKHKSNKNDKNHHKDNKDRHRKDKYSKKDKKRDKEKDSDKEKEKGKKKEKNPEPEGVNNELNYSDLDIDVDIDVDFDEDVDETMMECYKIFNEYKPTEEKPPTPPPQQVENKDVPENSAGKKRIAHASVESKNTYHKVKSSPNPALIMSNRFKAVKVSQASNEGKNLMNDIKQNPPPAAVKRPPPTLLEAARSHKLQKIANAKATANVVDSILNGAKVKPRIAPVHNVGSIQRAKAKIEELAKLKAAQTVNKTPAQNVKGSKRVAHIPDYSLSDIPDVLCADKSKLPVNVRTRYLTMIADECVKLYLNKEDAYNRALNEEFTCYEKCKVLATYRNSAMLAVSRLRKEFQEREKSGSGLYENSDGPNSGKSTPFKGKRFYESIKKYLMTDDDLDLHGYPRESPTPGHAVIKSNRNKMRFNLRENQRRCSRCGKIYLVDDDGYVLFNEECLYHPLKKRTLRGESTYLCCKSNDDTGCVTSNTHVSEMSEEAELEGFQITLEPERDDDPRSYAVYALDCEMCYTVKGLELTRVTIVDTDCKTVYETLVKPLNPIIDYNTNFSGITKEQMDRTSTSILQVQANILHLCNSSTILIGHSLESDMKALKIIHSQVIDTSVLFPHKMGLPHKRALRVLASEFLKKIIQNSVSGHDSAEDAIACMELVKWKLTEELKVKGIK